MPGGHCASHHCHASSTTFTSAMGGIAASSVSSRNADPSCNPWCASCGALRYVLVFLCMLGCAIDYMLRFDISVAIVAMVNTSYAQDSNSTSFACPAAQNASQDAQSTTGGGEYHWSEQEQGLVLGAFFWGYLITKAIGGRIAEKLGPYLTVASTMGLCGILSLLTPTMADVHATALAALRLLMGLVQGPIFPAMYSIMSRWSLPGETATMVSLAYSGAFLGSLISLGFSGMVIKSFGWRWVFWGCGVLTLLWVPFWLIYARDSPRQHPGISNRELSRLSVNHNQPQRKVPWSRILRSRHVYLLIMAEFAYVWTQGILLTEAPTFLTTQIGLDLQMTGMVGLVSSGVGWMACVFYGWLADSIRRRELLRVVNIRRLFQGLGALLVAGGSTGLLLAGCDAAWVAVYLIAQGMALPLSAVTYALIPMDIAPNYAGTLSGLTGLGTISGFLSPVFTSTFKSKENGWNIIFLTNLALYATASLIYIIGVSAEHVEWNTYRYEEIPGDDHHPTKEKRRGGRERGRAKGTP